MNYKELMIDAVVSIIDECDADHPEDIGSAAVVGLETVIKTLTLVYEQERRNG